jgi:DNA invertase Pin-like site-specific DNA recombinase
VKQKPKIKEAIIYTRFSPRRNADTCESLDTQYEICSCHCKMHDMTVVGSYEDEGISGKDANNRPGLQNAIDHAIRIKGVLLFYSLSRLARSCRDALLIAEKLDKGGAGLCSVKETFDTTTPMGKCIYTIMSAFNELDRKKIAIHTSDAMLRHQSNGRRMSSKLPYGWRDDPHDEARMLPDDYEREVIGVIMDLRTDGIEEETGEELAGLSLRDIARELTVKGYIPRQTTRTVDGKKITVAGIWQFGTIGAIINRQELNPI